jgi:predicted transcriptional regulator
MVAAVRRGHSQHAVARQFGVSLATVQYWVDRARGQRLDRVDWSDRSHAPRAPHRTDRAIEDLVLSLRRELAETSDLGACGAKAIHRALQGRGSQDIPSIRTIGRILERRGALDRRRRVRRPPPPRGWYLPDLAARHVELDSFDIVEGLVIKDGPRVEVLNGVSLHGGLVASWPMAAPMTAKAVVEALIGHWRAHGLPGYAQFDNDTIFQGTHTHPDVIGRVMRLCLSLGVIPVFVPPREMGFQAMIESYNGQWQAKVWARFAHGSLAELQGHSDRYVAAVHRTRADRIEAAPPRRPFPERWRLNLQAHPRGQVVYLRRTDASGKVEVLGHSFTVDTQWPNRLVRVEFDLTAGRLRFFALRRREPAVQPMLRELSHHIPRRRFNE